MKRFLTPKVALLCAGMLVFSAVATSQFKQILRAGGVVAVVSAFGKDINKGINKLWGREDSNTIATKVVPIVSVGSGTSIGAAQVMGKPDQVKRVIVVAQPEAKLFGELRLRALIPVANKDVKGGSLDIVDGVGVSGIVDIKL